LDLLVLAKTSIPNQGSTFQKTNLDKSGWEYKKCGREPGGEKVHELGECPAATEAKVNGIHGGENGGRCCWVVVGTFCNGEVQGTYVRKYNNCRNCDFYKSIMHEELKAGTFVLIAKISQMLGN